MDSGAPDPIQIEINELRSLPTDFDVTTWIKDVLAELDIKHGSFEFTFMGNDGIIEVNQAHLKRDYATDIISFNLGTPEDIEGDVYISVEKASENAKDYQQSITNELRLLIIHGILHLLDYRDYTDEEKAVMTAKQDEIMAKLTHEK